MSAIVKTEECRFDPVEHKYYRGAVELPSITTILKSVWPRTDSAPEDAIEKARLRGEWVDKYFAQYLTEGYVDLAGVPRTQEWEDCLGQAITFWDAERKGAKVETQNILYGEHEAGTADLIIDGCEIWDLKSTWEISKTVAAQLGGYGDLYTGTDPWRHPDDKMKSCGVLHVHRRYKKAQFRAFDYEDCWNQWRIVRSFWRLINGK